MKMFKIYMVLVISFFCLSTLLAEDRVVPPNTPEALQGIIDASNPGDVLLLAAGGVFPNTGTVVVDTFLTIRSTGNTKLLGQPRILETPNLSGDYKKTTLQINDDVILIDLLFDGQLKGRDATGNDIITKKHIKYGALNLTVIIDSCTFVRAAERAIEVTKPGQRLTITNCLFTDNQGGGGNGRLLDLREGPHKFIKMENTSSYYSTDRIFRHLSFASAYTPVIDTVIINHNTFTHNLGFIAAFQFQSVKYLQFTNNLVWNGGALGSDTMMNRIHTREVRYLADSLVSRVGPDALVMMSVTEAAKYNTKVLINHNNFYLDDLYKGMYDKYEIFQRYPTYCYELQDLVVASGIDTNDAVFEEKLVLGKVPDPAAWIDELDSTFWFRSDTSAFRSKVRPWNGRTDTLYLHKQAGFEDPTKNAWDLLDFTYPTTSTSYTAGYFGFPVGDLNWFPDRKAQWIADGHDAIQTSDKKPERFELSQNYPNPFNPTTTINYTLNKPQEVSLSIYSITGQLIKSVQKGVQAKTGLNTVKVDMSGYSSGMYFYVLKGQNQTVTKKMMFIK